jgi:hypothetical protein
MTRQIPAREATPLRSAGGHLVLRWLPAIKRVVPPSERQLLTLAPTR